MHIGNFTQSKEGGWIGFINTLTTRAKICLIPNDDRTGENSPTFHILHNNLRIGEAREAKTLGSLPKNYLRVRIDDPSLKEPLRAVLFFSDSGNAAELVWNRRKSD